MGPMARGGPQTSIVVGQIGMAPDARLIRSEDVQDLRPGCCAC